MSHEHCTPLLDILLPAARFSNSYRQRQTFRAKLNTRCQVTVSTSPRVLRILKQIIIALCVERGTQRYHQGLGVDTGNRKVQGSDRRLRQLVNKQHNLLLSFLCRASVSSSTRTLSLVGIVLMNFETKLSAAATRRAVAGEAHVNSLACLASQNSGFHSNYRDYSFAAIVHEAFVLLTCRQPQTYDNALSSSLTKSEKNKSKAFGTGQ